MHTVETILALSLCTLNVAAQVYIHYSAPGSISAGSSQAVLHRNLVNDLLPTPYSCAHKEDIETLTHKAFADVKTRVRECTIRRKDISRNGLESRIEPER